MLASHFAVAHVPGSPAEQPDPSVPQICPPDPALSGVEGADVRRAPVRRWKVTHACDAHATVLAVAQAQFEAGMHPRLLMPGAPASSLAPAGWPTPARSWQMWDGTLLHRLREFRRWRHLLAAERSDCDILHAHCFGAALAAVLAKYLVTYDLHASVAPVSSLSSAGARPAPHSPWAMRIAEDLVLARAAVVVVHSRAMWAEALRRGVRTEDLFLVPDPVNLTDVPRAPLRATPVVLFAPDAATEADVSMLLSAFATLSAEVDGAQLLLAAEGELAAVARREAERLQAAPTVCIIAPAECQAALGAAHIVIAGNPPPVAPSLSQGGDVLEPSPSAIAAFAHGRALLAADVRATREVTAQGSGCVWYRAGDARDLACRAAFLARNPDFRAALATRGRAHLAATRGPAAVARMYDTVYRHAWRKRQLGPHDAVRQLQVLPASL